MRTLAALFREAQMLLVSWTATPIRDGYLNPRHFGNVNDDLTVLI
jgi:hypothetical protein